MRHTKGGLDVGIGVVGEEGRYARNVGHQGVEPSCLCVEELGIQISSCPPSPFVGIPPACGVCSVTSLAILTFFLGLVDEIGGELIAGDLLECFVIVVTADIT